MDDFDLQSQLDAQLGSDYNADLQDNSQYGADYLGGQTDWGFGNYGDQWANYNDNSGFDLQNQLSNQLGQNYNADLSSVTQMPTQQQVGGLDATKNFLSDLFSGSQGKAMTAGLGALLEGYQNKKRASALSSLANQIQQTSDPFGSQRGYYQQQLQNTVTDPYSQPIVASQVAQLQRAQAIKDAAAGRRSNSATSSPSLLAAQAQIAQNYMNSLMSPAGANLTPNTNALAQLGQQQALYGSSGYLSPLISALGQSQQSNINQQTQQNTLASLLQQALAGGK